MSGAMLALSYLSNQQLGREAKQMTLLYDLARDWRSAPRDDRPPFLLCLYTGVRWPPYCAPMPREPALATGAEFDERFLATYRAAVACNPAIHDGAVLVGRDTAFTPYRVAAWSMRLFPPQVAKLAEPNRGSAFNSCLEMSCVAAIDCMYLVSEGSLIRFEKGRWETVG